MKTPNTLQIWFLVVLVGLSSSVASYAQVRYVTDNFEVMLRTGPSIQNKIVRPMSSGTRVEILSESAGNGHSLVQTPEGETGYVLTRFLTPNRAARERLKVLEAQLKKLRSEPGQLQTLLADSQDENRTLIQQNTGLSDQLQKASEELNQIKLVSADAVALSERNERLEKEVRQLLLQFDDIRIQNETFKDQKDLRYFIYGGGTLFLGLLFGWILSRSKRPNRNSWGA